MIILGYGLKLFWFIKVEKQCGWTWFYGLTHGSHLGPMLFLILQLGKLNK